MSNKVRFTKLVSLGLFIVFWLGSTSLMPSTPDPTAKSLDEFQASLNELKSKND